MCASTAIRRRACTRWWRAGAGKHARRGVRVRQRGGRGAAGGGRRSPAGAQAAGPVRAGPVAASGRGRSTPGVGAGGIAWAISELDLQPVYLNFADNAHLMVTGRRECGRTTTLATIMSEIGRIYAPGASTAPPTSRPSAQVWLVDPRRQLLTVLGSDYVEKFAYNLDGVAAMMDDLAAALAAGSRRRVCRPRNCCPGRGGAGRRSS
ncbi:ESX-5 secretion system eccCb5 domain protein [Mycobacterium xenopi 3993]|nr:ESX-5 secretion system eccCb5 domain protein [Mycobacterium xenopi 3993]